MVELYEFQFYEKYLVFKRFNYRYEAEYEHITGIEEGLISKKMTVLLVSSPVVLSFRLLSSEHTAFYRAVQTHIPAMHQQYEIIAPFLFTYKNAKYQFLMPIGSVILVTFSVLAGLGRRDASGLIVPYVLLIGGLYLMYAFWFRKPMSILFEESQIIVNRRIGTKVYAASKLEAPRVVMEKNPLAEGLHSYFVLKMVIDGDKYEITSFATDMPLTAIESFIRKTYFKDIV